MSISQNFPTITPTLNLNFARSKKLDPRITFTRTSSATRTNGQGLIEVVGANTPRFEHSVVGVGSTVTSVQSLGLLIEESRTNLVTYSEQFNDASWTKSNLGITTNTSATTAPDGSTNAEKLVEDTTASTFHRIEKSLTSLSSGNVTYSVYLKSAGRDYAFLRVYNITNASSYINVKFNLSSGTIDYTDTGTASITNVGNGWYRCVVTANNPSTSNNIAYVYLSNQSGSSEAYTGDGTSGVYAWGAQLEAGAFATSYIPTVASTVTRTGDLAFINLPSTGWYNYSQGSLIFQHSTVPYGTGTSPGYPSVGFAQTDGTSVNAILYFFVKNNGGTQYLVRDANVDQATLSPTTPTGASAGKVGFAYTTNSFVLARNGSQVGTDTSGTVPQSIGTLLLGTNEKSVANNLNACISNVIYYPRALSSSQLQNLTK